MASIELKHIHKHWGQFVAVDDFNLTIADNEFLVLLGPSGCGKTTTMRMIAGLEEASSGDILIDGKRVNDLEPKDRDVAMVFQSYGLYPNMNVYENIRFPLKVRKIDRPAMISGSGGPQLWLSLMNFCIANQLNYLVVSGNVWHWPGPLCANRMCS